LHTHDDHGRFAAALDYKALVVFHGTVHDLAELSSGDVGIYAALHVKLQCIN
jgi:hypothetical protein